MIDSWPYDLDPADPDSRLGLAIGFNIVLLAAAISGMILSILRFACPD
jgi:hypothetical protein